MNPAYKYSICHPDRAEIEYPSSLLDKEQVFEMVRKYPWVHQMKVKNGMSEGEVYYNPSLDFTHKADNHSLTLTADMDHNNVLDFSLWYNRPVKMKIFFGLLGNIMKRKEIDKWSFSEKEALSCLEVFLNRDYDQVEQIMMD